MIIRFFTKDGDMLMLYKPALRKAYIIAFAFVVLIALMTIIFRSANDVALIIPKAPLSEGWFIEHQGEEVVLYEYPTRVAADPGEHYTIYKTIHASDQPLYLLLYTDHQDVIIRLNDDIVYMSSQEMNSYRFYINMHHIITIEHDSDVDQLLSITYHSPYARTAGLIYPIYESTESTSPLYQQIVLQHVWIVGFGVLFIVMGIVVISISHVIDQARARGSYYLAFFAIIFGFWVIVKSTALQFITSNLYLLGGLQFTLFMILPIPLLLYYKNSVTKKFERETLAIIGYFGAQAIVITFLQIIGVLDFVRPLLFVSIMLLMTMITLPGFIVVDVLNHNELAKKFSRYYGILFLYGFITFINDQTFNHDDLAIYSLAVLALLTIIIFIDYIVYIETRLKLSYLSESYEKLAYMDRLTGSKNRHAYEEDFERLFSDSDMKKNLRLVFFDFDGLKLINDQYGHIEGDFALKEGFRIILDAFGRYGDCYRIGGDEFSCIIQSLDDDLYHSCEKKLVRDIKAFSSYHKFSLKISMGTAIYNEAEDNNPNDMIMRADKNMYEHKKRRKNA